MALTKDKKHQVFDEVTALLNDSRMTVVAAYQGTSVKAMQKLRRDAKQNGTVVKVVKNRLVIKAIVLILALSGWTTLWAAIASDVGSMLVVTLNAMTLLPAGSRSHKEDGVSNGDVEKQPANQSRTD